MKWLVAANTLAYNKLHFNFGLWSRKFYHSLHEMSVFIDDIDLKWNAKLWWCERLVMVWHCDGVTLWWCGIVMVWLCDGVTLWWCDFVMVWHCDGMMLWWDEIVMVWHFKSLVVVDCIVIIFNVMMLWRCVSVTLWHSYGVIEVVMVWSYVCVIMKCFDYLVAWHCDVLMV
jgi:hypothetical protein